MGTINPPALAAIRACQGLSQRQLAASAGISFGFLSKIEAGRAAPSEEVVKSLALALGVSLAAITCPQVLANAS